MVSGHLSYLSWLNMHLLPCGVLKHHLFPALGSCQLEKCGGPWAEGVHCPMSYDHKVDLFGLSHCACCMANSVKVLAYSYAGPSLLSLTSNVTATQI